VATTILFVRDLFAGSGASFPDRSRCGCGSPCCSPISPRRSPRAAARAQAASLRRTQSQAVAKRLDAADSMQPREVPAAQLKIGDIVLVETGDLVPSDGEIIEGIASVE